MTRAEKEINKKRQEKEKTGKDGEMNSLKMSSFFTFHRGSPALQKAKITMQYREKGNFLWVLWIAPIVHVNAPSVGL